MKVFVLFIALETLCFPQCITDMSRAMFPLIIFLAEQKCSLLGRHFSHLSKNILYTRPVQRAQKKCVTFNLNVLFIFDLTLDITKD